MRKTNLTIALALVAAIAPAAATSAQASDPDAPPASAGDTYVPGELLVRTEDGAERLVELPEGVGVAEAASALNAKPRVDYAVPNYIARASAVPNDTGFGGPPGDWQRTQWNFLACGSICTLNLPPSSGSPQPGVYEARGGINAVGAWDVLAQRGAPFGQGREGRGPRHRSRLPHGAPELPPKPRLRRQPVSAGLRLRQGK